MCGLPLGDVTRDLGKTNQLAAFVAHGVDDDEGPKAAAVLAQPPAFRAEASRFACGCKSSFRNAIGAVLWRVKSGKRSACYLFRRVALQSRSSRVPTYDGSIDVHQEDRVIDDRIDEQLQPAWVVNGGQFRGLTIQFSTDLPLSGTWTRQV